MSTDVIGHVTPDEHAGWYPIAAADDLADRHVFHGQLLGTELVVWRADDGFVNVWENRCLHRGVRLTLGRHDGGELVCRYHGWRYASRTAGCTYIPAQPGTSPAAGLCNTTYPAVEVAGLIWTTLGPGDDQLAWASTVTATVSDGPTLTLRALPLDAPAATVREALDRPGDAHSDPMWFVQPLDDHRCVVRGVLPIADSVNGADRLDLLRTHHRWLSRVRDQVERAHQPAPRHPAGSLQQVQVRRTMPTPATLQVRVATSTLVAEGIRALELEPLDGLLPTALPGAHVDVHLHEGITRQYSLVNAPGEQNHYVIAVKREPVSRGGSAFVHDSLAVGDTLTISAPRHQFVLRRDGFHTVLVAGGIGITPLLAMAQALHANGLSYELHYFAQSAGHVAFGDRLAVLGDAVHLHLGRTPTETAADLSALLTSPADGSHLYVCGPGPMLDAARAQAAELGWPDEAVHFEYFANPNTLDTSAAFEVTLARTGTTLTVPAGVSLLDVLRGSGVDLPSSCQQGACGTCAVSVVAGQPVHQDVYLNASERAANQQMMSCVSRAAPGERLVLDL